MGRQKGGYGRGPSKGHGECDGDGNAGKRVGSVTRYGDGEGEMGSKLSFSPRCSLSPGLLLFALHLTEQRKKQALPHSSWSTKEAQPSLRLVQSS